MDSPSEGRQPKRRCLNGAWQVSMAEAPTQASLTQPIHSSHSLPGFQQPNSTQWQASVLDMVPLSHSIGLPMYHNIGRSPPLLQQYPFTAPIQHHNGPSMAASFPEEQLRLQKLFTGMNAMQPQGYYAGHSEYGFQMHNPLPATTPKQMNSQMIGGMLSGASQLAMSGACHSNLAHGYIHPPSHAKDVISDTLMSMEAPPAELVCFGMVSPADKVTAQSNILTIFTGAGSRRDV